MTAELCVVGVETAEGDVQQFDPGAGDDELGGELQRRGELVL